MAARKRRKTGRKQARSRRSQAPVTPPTLIENVQQIWLAGMGAIARAQREGPGAFTEAVAEGFKLLNRSRSGAEQVIRDAFDAAQASMQTHFGSARDQAAETWDNLEALFQTRVQKALNQLGVPSAEEIRALTRRVADLNESVLALSAKQVRAKRAAAKRATRKPRAKRGRRARSAG